MAVITHDARLAFDASTGAIAENVLGAVYLDTDTGLTTPLEVTIFGAGSTTTTITSDINGVIPEFTLDQAANGLTGEEGVRIVWASGAHRTVLLSTSRVYDTLNGRAPVFVSTGGDDTAALNAYLSGGTGVRRLVGSFTLTDAITVPAGVTLDASSATLTQTGANKVTVILGGDGAAMRGGTIVGKGPTDYVAGSAINAAGVSTNATTGCRVRDVTITDVAGAGIKGTATTGLLVDGCRIVGVGAPTIATGVGASCYGIYLDTGAVRTTITGCDISAANQGIIAGTTVTHLTISDTAIHDIPGQHGIYAQNGTGLNVSGLNLSAIQLNGVKVQLASTSAADSEATSLRGLTVTECGDTALSINNTAADLTSAKRFRGLTVSDVAVTDSFRVLYLGSVRGGAVSNVAGYNTTSDGVTILDCQDVTVTNVALDDVGRVGVRITSATGSVTQRLGLRGVRINNAAAENVANNIYGVYIAQGDYITFDDLVVTADNGFMQYGLFLASSTASHQETFSLRNADLRGDTGASARFQSTVTSVRDWTNNRMAGAPTFKPNGIVAVVAVP